MLHLVGQLLINKKYQLSRRSMDLHLPCGLSLKNFWTKSLNEYFTYPIRGKYPIQFILLDLIKLSVSLIKD